MLELVDHRGSEVSRGDPVVAICVVDGLVAARDAVARPACRRAPSSCAGGLRYVQSTSGGAPRNRSSASAWASASALYSSGNPGWSMNLPPSGLSRLPPPPTQATRGTLDAGAALISVRAISGITVRSGPLRSVTAATTASWPSSTAISFGAVGRVGGRRIGTLDLFEPGPVDRAIAVTWWPRDERLARDLAAQPTGCSDHCDSHAQHSDTGTIRIVTAP